MFKSVGRYFRAVGYLFTGRIDAARRAISTSPHVIQATFDSVIEDKRKSVIQYKDAIARLIVQHESKMSKIKTLSDEVNRLEQLKEGAAAKARTVASKMMADGASVEQVKSGEDYQKCMIAFNDFSAKVNSKTERINELELEVKEMDGNITGHKVQLQQMLREIESLKEEAATTVAEVITAKEEQELNDMLSGISADRTSKELSDMRQLREEMKAKAKVSKELAGTDTKVQEAEFLDYATKNVATSEFDQLIGLAEKVDEGGDGGGGMEREGKTRLPE